MDGAELRRRLDRLGDPYIRLAPRLGLSATGLHKQMRGERPVSRQTALLLERLEQDRRGSHHGGEECRRL
jgi:hypothetical protein